MREKIRKLQENAILRFWFSYILVLMLVFLVCAAGFQQALHIVKENIYDQNESMLRQGIRDTDNMFHDLSITGMKITGASSLKQLDAFSQERGVEYYYTIKAALTDYADNIKYFDSLLSTNTFIYMNSMDRVLYDNAVYNKNVFQSYPDKWGVTMEEWMGLCQEEQIVPRFRVSENGQLFYLFSCVQSKQNTDSLGTLFFHIDEEDILKHMTFLNEYSEYSLLITQGEETLFAKDGLLCRDRLAEDELQKQHIVISMESEMGQNCIYTLVLPRQEALLRLQKLQESIWILVFLAAAAGTAFAFYFSARSGRPINNIAHKLQEQNDQGFSTDLNLINATIDQIIEEQKKDQAARQKTFFHNLLKADFLSRTEMEYMAQRANLQLEGKVYYAAAIRFFPEIDVDSIDGRTVEEVRALQTLTQEKLEQEYSYGSWSYKRNTLIMQYIIEEDDQEKLFEALGGIIIWLRNHWHVDAYWGVGSPCSDLMQFWKSTEEANAALNDAEADVAIRLYAETAMEDKTYYLPYSMEEHLMQALRSGDKTGAENTLRMIQNENFVRRTISRKQFLKLHNCLSEILAEQAVNLEHWEEYFLELGGILMEDTQNEQKYFTYLEKLCREICQAVTSQKSQKRTEKMQSILEFVEENYQNPGMGLGMVSDRFKLSEGYFSALFKDEMAVNFADYLENLRITEACRLLKEGELVANIAEKIGYNSVQSFRRAFKRVMEVSPSEYRE